MSMLCFLADVVPPLCCQVGQNKRCGSQQDSLAGMMPLWAACATRRCGTVIRGVQAARLQMLKWSKHIGAAAVRSAFACLPHPCCWWQLTTPCCCAPTTRHMCRHVPRYWPRCAKNVARPLMKMVTVMPSTS